MERIGTTKAMAQGNTIYVRIPRAICLVLDIKSGDEMTIDKDENKIVFSKDLK